MAGSSQTKIMVWSSRCDCGNAQALHNVWNYYRHKRLRNGKPVSLSKEEYISQCQVRLLNDAVSAVCMPEPREREEIDLTSVS